MYEILVFFWRDFDEQYIDRLKRFM